MLNSVCDRGGWLGLNVLLDEEKSAILKRRWKIL